MKMRSNTIILLCRLNQLLIYFFEGLSATYSLKDMIWLCQILMVYSLLIQRIPKRCTLKDWFKIKRRTTMKQSYVINNLSNSTQIEKLLQDQSTKLRRSKSNKETTTKHSILFLVRNISILISNHSINSELLQTE